MKAGQKTRLGVSLFAVVFLMLGLAAMPRAASAAAPMYVDFRVPTISNLENNGVIALKVRVTNANLNSVAHDKIKVKYQISGTANTADYVFNFLPNITSGTFEIPADSTGVDYKVFLVPTADFNIEPNETVVVKIVGVYPEGKIITLIGANNTFTATILNDDSTFDVQFKYNSSGVNEYDAVGTDIPVEFKDIGGHDMYHGPVTIQYQVSSLSTANASDFLINGNTGLAGTVTVPAGIGDFMLRIAPVNDLIVEGNERLVVRIITVSNGGAAIAQVGANQYYYLDIVDDDDNAQHWAQFRNSGMGSPENFGTNLVYFAFIDEDYQDLSHAAMDIFYEIDSSSTASPSDYVFNSSPDALSGVIHVPAGAGDFGVPMQMVNDALTESEETVVIRLTGVAYSDPSGFFTLSSYVSSNMFTFTIIP